MTLEENMEFAHTVSATSLLLELQSPLLHSRQIELTYRFMLSVLRHRKKMVCVCVCVYVCMCVCVCVYVCVCMCVYVCVCLLVVR